jgi:hypothetical protein
VFDLEITHSFLHKNNPKPIGVKLSMFGLATTHLVLHKNNPKPIGDNRTDRQWLITSNNNPKPIGGNNIGMCQHPTSVGGKYISLVVNTGLIFILVTKSNTVQDSSDITDKVHSDLGPRQPWYYR